MWRFLTLDDPLVDLTIFRDLDSTLNEREKAAVEEWLHSNYTMHLMRDHTGHKQWILGDCKINIPHLYTDLKFRRSRYFS